MNYAKIEDSLKLESNTFQKIKVKLCRKIQLSEGLHF